MYIKFVLQHCCEVMFKQTKATFHYMYQTRLYLNEMFIILKQENVFTVMIHLSGHICSRLIFPNKRVFRITESPISPDMEIGSHLFCPD